MTLHCRSTIRCSSPAQHLGIVQQRGRPALRQGSRTTSKIPEIIFVSSNAETTPPTRIDAFDTLPRARRRWTRQLSSQDATAAQRRFRLFATPSKGFARANRLSAVSVSAQSPGSGAENAIIGQFRSQLIFFRLLISVARGIIQVTASTRDTLQLARSVHSLVRSRAVRRQPSQQNSTSSTPMRIYPSRFRFEYSVGSSLPRYQVRTTRYRA